MADALKTDLLDVTLVDVQKLSGPTDKEKEDDKLYLKDVNPNASSDETGLIIMNAAMSSVTVLSFLAGPTGIVIGAGVVLLQGVLPLGGAQQGSIAALQQALAANRLEGMLDDQLTKVRAVANWIKLRRSTWDEIDVNLSEFKKTDLTYLNAETGPDLTSLFTKVAQLEDKMEWDKPSVRVLVILSYTLLFVCYSMICRLHTALALAANSAKKDDEVRSHSASYRGELRVFKEDLKGRCESFRKAMADAAKRRREAVEFVGSHSESAGQGFPVCYWIWKDNYTGKEDWLMYNQAPGWLGGNKDERKAQAEKKMEEYKKGLEEHIQRVLRNDTAIVAKWEAIAVQAAQLLNPAPPTTPPPLSTNLNLIEKPHPLLKDATHVAWCYSLGTKENDVVSFSKPSPWTSWFVLQQENGKFKLPKLTTKDNGFLFATQRKVYHLVLKAGDDAAKVKPGEGLDIEKYVADIFEAKGDWDWVDSEPIVNGAK